MRVYYLHLSLCLYKHSLDAIAGYRRPSSNRQAINKEGSPRPTNPDERSNTQPPAPSPPPPWEVEWQEFFDKYVRIRTLPVDDAPQAERLQAFTEWLEDHEEYDESSSEEGEEEVPNSHH